MSFAGSVWTKSKNTNEFWEVEIYFKVTGRGRIGGDGLVSHFTCDVNKFDSSPILISDLNPDLEPDP